MSGITLHRFAIVLSVLTLFLVVAGASVVSKEAGLSVPDWPLSYGKVMPEMTGGVFYEHGHRMVATTVGFLTIILAVWLWRVEDRRWMKWLGVAALGMVIAQGVLGGMTVRYLLPKAISISHACLAQLFFSLTVAIALFTSPSWRESHEQVADGGWPSLRSLAWIMPIGVLAQVALGAAFRHKAFSVLPHVTWAFGVTLLIIMTASFALTQTKTNRPLRKASVVVLSVTVLQVLLGVAAYVARLMNTNALEPQNYMVVLTVAHTATGALLMGLSVALSILILRHVHAKEVVTVSKPGELVGSGRAS